MNESTGEIVVTSTIGTVAGRVLNAEIDNRGTMTIDRPVRIETSGVNHVNSGTMAFNASGSSFRNFATLTNTATGSITAAAGLTINYFTTLTNDGLIDIDGGEFNTHSFTDMTNAGTVTVDGGYWNLSSYSTLLNTGIIRMADDQRFSVTGGVVTHAGTELSGYQLYFTSNAELALPNDWTNVDSLLYLYAGSRMTGAGTVTNQRNIHAYNATIETDLVNEGLVDFHYNDANSISYINGSFVNAATGTLRIRALTYYGYSDEYATLTVASGFSNYGLIELTDTYNSYGSATYVTLNVGGTLVNESTGQIVVTSTIGSVAGRVLNAEIDNRGTIRIERNTAATKAGTSFTNSGRLEILAGATLTQTGVVINNFSGGALSGGAYEIGGIWQFTDAAITTIAADLTLVGAGSAIRNQSNADALAGLTTIDGAGRLTLRNGRSVTAALLTVDGVLAGAGTIRGSVTNNGLVAPDGVLTITGDYTETLAGELAIDVGGYVSGDEYDVLGIGGVAALAGTLSLVTADGFTPVLGDTFDVMSFASRTGDFSLVTGMELPDSWRTSRSSGRSA